MVKADYDYQIITAGDEQIIAIQDLDKGGCSVTNDIENVVEEICKDEALECNECLVIYCDSTGIWDGWDHKTQSFVPLQCRKVDVAITTFLKRKAADNGKRH